MPDQEGPESRGAQRETWAAQRAALGAFIREHRKQANLSLRQLAERTRLSNPYLSQIERGLHQPSVRVLRAISDALNLSAETLLTQAGLIDALAAGTDPDAAEARRRWRAAGGPGDRAGDPRRQAPYRGPEVRAARRLPQHAPAGRLSGRCPPSSAGRSRPSRPSLRCPVCAGQVLAGDGQVDCDRGHSFNIARQGYVSLTSGRGGPGTGDSAAMVMARERFLGGGHYRPVADAIAGLAARLDARRPRPGARPGRRHRLLPRPRPRRATGTARRVRRPVRPRAAPRRAGAPAGGGARRRRLAAPAARRRLGRRWC